MTAWDLASQSSKRIQSQFNVVVARTVMELNGTACMELEDITPNKQQIVCSRSFSRRLTTYSELSQALSEFCSRAAEKLRRHYQRSATIKLASTSQDTRTLITTANRLLAEIFRLGYNYQKCGVQLSHI
jgi:DNA polymerase V